MNALNSDTIRKWKDMRISIEQQSHYIRTTWMLSTEGTLKLLDTTCIRFFSEEEAEELAKLARKRNFFARHSWENHFYIERIRKLANTTVIEISRPCDPNDMIDEAQKIADLTEKLAFISSILIIPREVLQRRLAISPHRRSVFDITIGRKFYYLRSKSKPEPDIRGITIDEKFCRRFERCGFRYLAFA